jgi:hypothetical protein
MKNIPDSKFSDLFYEASSMHGWKGISMYE